MCQMLSLQKYIVMELLLFFFLLKIILSYLSNKITKHRSTSFVFYKQLGFLVQSGVA